MKEVYWDIQKNAGYYKVESQTEHGLTVINLLPIKGGAKQIFTSEFFHKLIERKQIFVISSDEYKLKCL